jgi:hypothetical protein
MYRLHRIAEAFNTFGWRGVYLRLKYLFRINFLRGSFNNRGGDGYRGPLFIAKPLDHSCSDSVRERANCSIRQLLAGSRILFHSQLVECGYPPRSWAKTDESDWERTIDMHWLNAMNSTRIDIKRYWDLSRLRELWHLPFVNDSAIPREEIFWTILSVWQHQNPYLRGVNWACGQECALRAIRVAVASKYFRMWESDTSKRDQISSFLENHAVRISQGTDYAFSQINNHGISESVGLIYVSFVLRDHEKSQMWRKTGQQALKWLLPRLFPEDGLYRQYSVNYQRFATELLLLLVGIMNENDFPVPEFVATALHRSTIALNFLVTNGSEGETPPNFGANDGSKVFDLFDDHFRSYRSVLEALKLYFGMGATDGLRAGRELLALSGVTRFVSPPRIQVAEGLLYAGHIRHVSPQFKALFKIYSHDSRPGQADSLHIDLSYKNRELLFDPGTYTYSDHEKYSAFASEFAHNICAVRGLRRFKKGPGFIWFDWTKVDFEKLATSQGVVISVASTRCYEDRSILLRRAVLSCPDWLLIADFVTSGKSVPITLNWNIKEKLPSSVKRSAKEFEVFLPNDLIMKVFSPDSVADFELKQALQENAAGWLSECYGVRESFSNLTCSTNQRSAFFATVLINDLKTHVEVCQREVAIGNLKIQFTADGRVELISSIVREPSQ